jgi:hypothetical protein
MGRSIPGLMAARLMQRKGARVAFLDTKYSKALSPSMCDFLSGCLVKPMLQRLGFHPAEMQKVFRLDVPTQVIAPNQRINYYRDAQKLTKELQRETSDTTMARFFEQPLAQDYDRISQLFARTIRFDGKKKWYKKSASPSKDPKNAPQDISSLLDHYGLSTQYANWFRSLELAYGYALSPQVSPCVFSHYAHLVQKYGYYALMGIHGLEQVLISQLKEKGALFLEYSQIDKVHRSGNKVQWIRTDQEQYPEIGMDQWVINGNPRAIIQALPEDSKMTSLAHMPKHLERLGKRMYFLFKIHKSLLPYGIRTQGIVFPHAIESNIAEKRTIPRVIRYLLHLPNQKAYDYQSYLEKLEDEYALLAITYCIQDKKILPMDQIKQEILDCLQTLIPFATNKNLFLIDSYVPSLQGQPGDYREGYLYKLHSQTQSPEKGMDMATDFKNAWRTGEMNYPSLGLDGMILAGDELTQKLR